MRIIAGTLGGQSIKAPAGIRPMAEKVRGALFNVLGDVKRQNVLDAYAGSGAIGFEALSRGAAQVVALERNAKVARVLEQNRTDLSIEWGHQLYKMSVETWLGSEPPSGFDLIVADPPYDSLEPDIMAKLADLLGPGGTLVVSQSSRIEPFELKQITLRQSKVYGDTALNFYTGGRERT
jgi:16S rRNA (guanine966-N2)-methyltransferase